jgi:hypothetical protein
MIHYHGGPITPETCAHRVWKGRHAFLSYATPRQLDVAFEVCQSVAIDCGAYPFWRAGTVMASWEPYYEWLQPLIRHPAFDWAVIPDVIAGSEAENDALLSEWPLAPHLGVPVWHVNESIGRLRRLAEQWPRVAIGSSGEYDVSTPKRFLARMAEVLPSIVNSRGQPICKLHGLRMLNQRIFTKLPLASADSTNVARNIGIDKAWKGTYQPCTKETRASVLVERIEHYNGAEVWRAEAE